MPLARWQETILFDDGGVVVKAPGAAVEFRREDSGAKPQLYSDRSGVTTKGNPFTADAEGFAFCYVTGGAYKVTVTYGDQEMILRHVPVGLLQESDGAVGGYKTTLLHTATGDVTIADDDANEIHKIDNTSGGPIAVYLPDVTLRGKPLRIVDGSGNANAYPITLMPKSGSSQTIMLGASYVIDSDGSSIQFDPDATDENWM